MPLLGLTVGIDLNGFLDSETQLTRVRAEKRGSKAVGSGGGKLFHREHHPTLDGQLEIKFPGVHSDLLGFTLTYPVRDE